MAADDPTTPHPLPSADDVAAWSPAERAAVARLLDEAAEAERDRRRPIRQRRLVLALTIVCALVLVPWILVLAYTLPTNARVTNWRVAWVGFDSLLALSFAASAWAVWKRRYVAVVALTAASVGLMLDTWFDVTLSWGTRQQWGAVALALFVELPVLAVLLVTVTMAMRRSGAAIARLRGQEPARSVLGQRLPMAPSPGERP